MHDSARLDNLAASHLQDEGQHHGQMGTRILATTHRRFRVQDTEILPKEIESDLPSIAEIESEIERNVM